MVLLLVRSGNHSLIIILNKFDILRLCEVFNG